MLVTRLVVINALSRVLTGMVLVERGICGTSSGRLGTILRTEVLLSGRGAVVTVGVDTRISCISDLGAVRAYRSLLVDGQLKGEISVQTYQTRLREQSRMYQWYRGYQGA